MNFCCGTETREWLGSGTANTVLVVTTSPDGRTTAASETGVLIWQRDRLVLLSRTGPVVHVAVDRHTGHSVSTGADQLLRQWDPETDLLRSLLARGECRPYHLSDAEDRPPARRFAFGVPTETVHWVTAAGIRPGVNSVILGDADGIARSCLRIVAEQPRLLVYANTSRRLGRPA